MKESKYSPYNKLLKRITFNNEQTVRKGGGVPTDVDFSDGKGTFGTATSVIDYGNSSEFNLRSNFSLRARFNFVSTGSNQALIAKGGGSTTQYILSITSSDKIRFFGYEGGVAKGNTIGVTITEGEHEVIATFNGTHWICYVDSVEVFDTVGSASLTDTTQSLQIGARSGTTEWKDTIDLIEIYSGVLTPSEVANLYNGTWNKELPPKNVLIDFDSTQGAIKCGDITPTITSVTTVKSGSNYSAKFNGTDSKISVGCDPINTKAFTLMTWAKAYSNGESNEGTIINNGRLQVARASSTNCYYISGNSGHYVKGSDNSFELNKWQFLAITRAADGTASIYMGGLHNAPALSGAADRDSGTPAVGSTNLIIGNRDANANTFDGLIPKITVVENVLDINDITRYWSSSRRKI